MLSTWRTFRALLNPRERHSFVIVVVIMVIESLFEVAAVACIPLFITAIAYPEGQGAGSTVRSLVTEYWPASAGHIHLMIAGSLLLAGFFIVKTLFNVLATYWKARFAQNRGLKLSVRLFAAYLRAPHTFHLQSSSADLFRNVNQECLELANRVLLPMVEFISQTIIVAGILAVLIYVLPPSVLLWLFAFVAMSGLCTSAVQQRIKRLGKQAQVGRGRIVRTISEGLNGAKEIRLLQRVPYFVERLQQSLTRILSIQRTVQVVQRSLPALLEAFGVLALIGVTIMLLLGDTAPEAIVMNLTVFAVAVARMKGALRGMMQAYTDVRHYGASLDVISEGLKALETDALKQRETPGSSPPDLSFTHSITLRSLYYRYPEATRDALADVELEILRGEAIGFVGTTGAGKSTLLDLILGILEPSAGEILVDGVNVHTALTAWQRRLGYVPQSLFLVDGSIVDNVALGVYPDQVDHRRLRQALSAAALDELIARLPQGANTPLGENGARLSGGERQRIAIARALYHEPDILVMDEATSALDNVTEAAVINAVEALKGDRTIMIIAHRLSTVRRCDRIVMLKNGTIDAIGSYDELLHKHDDFRRLAGG